MHQEQSKLQTCICQKQGCLSDDEQKIPSYCMAKRHVDEIKAAKKEYRQPENKQIYESACIVGAENDGFRPRIEEALHFIECMNFHKVGFAACVAFEDEIRILKELFASKGLIVTCAACPIGGVTAEERNIPEMTGYVNSICNPIAQAQILNREQTELNFIIGLCMGHDILFTRYSAAPVSTLIVKDRMTGNNPAAALYGHHARRHLFKLQRLGKGSLCISKDS